MWRNRILIHQGWDYKMVRPLWKTVWLFFAVQAVPLCIRNRWMIKSQVVVQSLSLCLTLRPHGLQHARLPCPSLSPRGCSDSCLSSWWCHLTISSSVNPFSSCLQSFPASGSFPMSWCFTSGGQSIGASASAWSLPMNIQGWFHLGSTRLISLLSKGLWRVFSNTTASKHQFFSTQPSL